MKFYIQLENGHNFFRLKKDERWERIDYKDRNKTSDEDYLTNDYTDFKNIVTENSSVNIENEVWTVNPSDKNKDNSNILLSSILIKREEFPKVPEIDQLIYVIANGNDLNNNTVVLKSDGNFELFENYNHVVNNPNVIVRTETFIAGNDYVGKEASKDLAHISSIYRASLEDWYSHLKTNNTNYFGELDHGSETIEELREKIELLRQDFF